MLSEIGLLCLPVCGRCNSHTSTLNFQLQVFHGAIRMRSLPNSFDSFDSSFSFFGPLLSISLLVLLFRFSPFDSPSLSSTFTQKIFFSKKLPWTRSSMFVYLFVPLTEIILIIFINEKGKLGCSIFLFGCCDGTVT